MRTMPEADPVDPEHWACVVFTTANIIRAGLDSGMIGGSRGGCSRAFAVSGGIEYGRLPPAVNPGRNCLSSLQLLFVY